MSSSRGLWSASLFFSKCTCDRPINDIFHTPRATSASFLHQSIWIQRHATLYSFTTILTKINQRAWLRHSASAPLCFRHHNQSPTHMQPSSSPHILVALLLTHSAWCAGCRQHNTWTGDREDMDSDDNDFEWTVGNEDEFWEGKMRCNALGTGTQTLRNRMCKEGASEGMSRRC